MTSKDVYRSNIVILCLLLFIGFILRLYQLGDESIWLDEGYSIYHSKLQFLNVFLQKDDIPPLYYLILHGWIKLFGDSEVSVRFPSLLFGELSIFFMYRIGALLFNDKKGLLAALLLTVSTLHVHYSQEARMYSLVSLLTLLSMYYLIKLYQGGGRTVAIGYVLSSALLIYSHVFGLFIIIAQNIYWLTLHLFSRDESTVGPKLWLGMQMTVIILFLPWVPTFLTRALDESREAYMCVPTKITAFRTFVSYSGKHILLFFLMFIFFSIISIKLENGVVKAKSLFQSFEKLEFKSKLIDLKPNYLLLLWLCLPIFLPFLLSRCFPPFYATRYTIAASLSFYLLAASGMENFRNVPVKKLAIVVVIVFSILNLWDYYSGTTREQWRDVANYVDHNSQNDDLIVFNSEPCRDHAFNYYSQTEAPRVVLPKTWNEVDSSGNINLLHLLNDHNRVWVVLSHPRINDVFIQAFSNQYRMLEHRSYLGIELYLFTDPNSTKAGDLPRRSAT